MALALLAAAWVTVLALAALDLQDVAQALPLHHFLQHYAHYYPWNPAARALEAVAARTALVVA